jgi:hypothetical protein
MNFDFAAQINPHLERMDMKSAIVLAEAELDRLPLTEFHDVIGRSLLHQASELAVWIDQFFHLVSKRMQIGALYFEMNEFDINTDSWYIDCFAYVSDQGLDPEDMEWLVEYDASSRDELGSVFVIGGYERLQMAFKTIDEKPADNNRADASAWCEQIIIARYMELIRAAHLSAKAGGMRWATIPIYFTEHSYDFIVKSETEN